MNSAVAFAAIRFGLAMTGPTGVSFPLTRGLPLSLKRRESRGLPQSGQLLTSDEPGSSRRRVDIVR